MSNKKNEPQAEIEATIEALGEDVLDQVTGAGNPFDNVPRVPEKPIDDSLREDA